MRKFMRLFINFCTPASKKKKSYNFDYYKSKES